jgi:ABC-type bacteriocin/lantibiotic exporter with double-glycine peptidase domain
MLLTSSRALFDEFIARSKDKKTKGAETTSISGKSNFRKYLEIMAPYRAAFLRIFLTAILTELLYLAVPITTRQIIDGVLMRAGISDAEKYHLLIRIGGILFATLVAAQILDFWRRFYTVLINGRFVRALRLRTCCRFRCHVSMN